MFLGEEIEHLGSDELRDLRIAMERYPKKHAAVESQPETGDFLSKLRSKHTEQSKALGLGSEVDLLSIRD